MKKFAAIFLLILFAFNWGGYQFVMNYLTNRADAQLEARIDVKDYDESQLIEIRVPLNAPYISDQPEFERHYGEVESNGVYYTYVERKIENGELVVKCIPNNDKKEIKKAANDYFKNTNGFDDRQDGNKHNKSAAKANSGDYDDTIETFNIYNVSKELFKPGLAYRSAEIEEICLSGPAQPPESVI